MGTKTKGRTRCQAEAALCRWAEGARWGDEEEPLGTRQNQLHGPGQHHPCGAGQEHPSRAQAPAPGARGQGTWAGGLRTVPGRTVPAGRLLLAVGLLKALVEMRLLAPLHPLLQAPVVAALLPEEQWVSLPVSGWQGAGLGTPWAAPHLKCSVFFLSWCWGSSIRPAAGAVSL